MRVLGGGELGRRAQQVVRDDPNFKDVLAVEDGGVLLLYLSVRSKGDPEWAERYVEWAKLTPTNRDTYRLAHLALSGGWQELDVERPVEACIRAIADNKYHLFFV
jgi:hypothetical protein